MKKPTTIQKQEADIASALIHGLRYCKCGSDIICYLIGWLESDNQDGTRGEKTDEILVELKRLEKQRHIGNI